jgi:hypothetical protein
MSSRSRLWVPVLVFATLAALAGCAPGSGGGSVPDGTTEGGGDDAAHDDPFEPQPPTTGDGWSERYTDIPWLSDDLDNDDFFVTGTVDGHDVLGIYCNDDGNGTGSILSVSDASTAVELQTPTDVDVTVARGETLTYTGIGTYALPADPQGTHPVTISFSSSIEYDAITERAAESTAEVALEMLGVPYPDVATCRAEQDDLFSWASQAGGH